MENEEIKGNKLMELTDKWLIESKKDSKKNTINYWLKSVNTATYNDIIRNPKKYEDKIMVMFTDFMQLTHTHIGDILTNNHGRWHVKGDPLNVYDLYGRAEPKAVQGWYDKTELIELMSKRIVKKYAWIITKEIK